ncbi:MAG: Stf0 family sulfotransferase [Pseudomonadota bacterium]
MGDQPLGYIVCATPRSGSTMLCDLLAACDAGRPASLFREESIPSYACRFGIDESIPTRGPVFDRRYLDGVLARGRSESGIFGLRLMWQSLAGLLQRLDGLFPALPDDAARLTTAFGPVRFVHLSRDNKVAQAVSLLRAQQSGLWHRHADGSAREQLVPIAEGGYDAQRLAAMVETATEQDAAWVSWFTRHAIAPIRITYEDLSADPQGTLATVLTALGLDASVAAHVAPQTQRLADAESDAWARRFRMECGG